MKLINSSGLHCPETGITVSISNIETRINRSKPINKIQFRLGSYKLPDIPEPIFHPIYSFTRNATRIASRLSDIRATLHKSRPIASSELLDDIFLSRLTVIFTEPRLNRADANTRAVDTLRELKENPPSFFYRFERHNGDDNDNHIAEIIVEANSEDKAFNRLPTLERDNSKGFSKEELEEKFGYTTDGDETVLYEMWTEYPEPSETDVGWSLDFVTYSGMTIPMAKGSFEELSEIADRKCEGHDGDVSIIKDTDSRKEWEFQTPDDAIMISDSDGFLIIEMDEEEFSEEYGMTYHQNWYLVGIHFSDSDAEDARARYHGDDGIVYLE